MVVTVAMAIGLLTTEPEVLKDSWLHIKLLCRYFDCLSFLLRSSPQTVGSRAMCLSSQQLRALNEAPTVL